MSINLWKSILNNQQQVWLKMHSGSMFPLMPTRSSILVVSLEGKNFCVGDIVLFIENNKFIAHRVLKLNVVECLQGGDSSFSNNYLIPVASVIGIIKKVKVNDKEFDLSSRTGVLLTWFITRTSLFIIFVSKFNFKFANLLHKFKIKVIYKFINYCV